MESEQQLTFDDLAYINYIVAQPNRLAFIDECGGFGFDFSKQGTPEFYLLCAIVIKERDLCSINYSFNEIKKNNGFGKTELKSSSINDSRRFRIMAQILPLEFRIVFLIANKKLFLKDTPLREYKPVFLKHINQRLYSVLYSAYPKLEIIQDETGTPEFRDSFMKYVESNRPENNLFGEYDFVFVDSKDEIIVQLADFIGGSLYKSLEDSDYYNYFEMLKGKIAHVEYFPNQHQPYWGRTNPKDCKYDDTIYALAVKSAKDFIQRFTNDENDYRKMQVYVLNYLLYYVSQVSPTQFVYSEDLIRHISENLNIKISRDKLFRRVIAPMRDEGVVLSSCSKGYKIPISVDDIVAYVNQTISTVGPMLQRIAICRSRILQNTDNLLDILDDKAFFRYKRYFEGEK